MADSMVTHMEGTLKGEDQKTFWRRLWSLTAPNKIKPFAQQVCRNIIPTKVSLCHRQVIDDDMCEACGLHKETGGHIFRECEATHEVWVQFGISFKVQGVRCNEFVDLVWYLIFIQYLGNDFLEMLFMIALSMSYNQNAARHESLRQFANLVVQKARVLLDEFQIVNHSISRPKEDTLEFWAAPIAPSYKVNVDDAVFS